MLKRKIVIFLALTVMCLLLVNSAYASWVLVEQNYNFERTSWETTPEVKSGYAHWKTDITNFRGYVADINLSQFDSFRDGGFGSWYIVYLIWVLENDYGENFIGIVRFKTYADWWGLSYGKDVYGGFGFNTTWDNICYFRKVNYDCAPSYVKIAFYINETLSPTQIVGKILVYDKDVPYPYRIAETYYSEGWKSYGGYPINLSRWNHTVLHFAVYFDGTKGSFKGGMSDTIYVSTFTERLDKGEIKWVTSNPFYDFLEGVRNSLSLLPSWLSGFFSEALSWFSTFTSVLYIIWNAFQTSMPFIPLILLFWVLDAVIASIQDGNLHPIGNVFMTIYDFIRGLVQTIVNIVNAVWDFISGD